MLDEMDDCQDKEPSDIVTLYNEKPHNDKCDVVNTQAKATPMFETEVELKVKSKLG